MKLKSVVRQNNKVKGYYIETEKGVKFISKKQLKQTMQIKGLLVEGLKLTRDGRLIESKKSRNPKDLKSPPTSKEQPKVPTEKPKQAKNRLKFQLELRKKLGITEPFIVGGIGYYIENNRVFCMCKDKNITKANILEGTEIIEYGTFESCTSLVSVTLPSSVNAIGYRAFVGCTSLTSVNIPDSVVKIGKYAFYGCTSLTSITISNSVTKIEGYTFYYCTSLTSINIPNTVTKIEECAFSRCTCLTSVNIPNSVTKINKYAFTNCNNLKYVYCYKGSKADNPSLYPTKVTFKYL